MCAPKSSRHIFLLAVSFFPPYLSSRRIFFPAENEDPYLPAKMRMNLHSNFIHSKRFDSTTTTKTAAMTMADGMAWIIVLICRKPANNN
jgi:hypothetical protein